MKKTVIEVQGYGKHNSIMNQKEGLRSKQRDIGRVSSSVGRGRKDSAEGKVGVTISDEPKKTEVNKGVFGLCFQTTIFSF